MSDETPEIKPDETFPSPLRCWTGSAIAGGMAFVAYLLTRNITASFASKPPTGNALALQIGVTVRTLVMGIFTMATGLFSLVAVGLVILGIQSLLTPSETTAPEEK
ncbi:MAG: DUF3082 domain-containing protein [Limnothrix sp.]